MRSKPVFNAGCGSCVQPSLDERQSRATTVESAWRKKPIDRAKQVARKSRGPGLFALYVTATGTRLLVIGTQAISWQEAFSVNAMTTRDSATNTALIGRSMKVIRSPPADLQLALEMFLHQGGPRMKAEQERGRRIVEPQA